MSSGPSYAVSDLAYTKIILHALKHPHQPVNGVLLGSPSSSGVVEIVDTIPLLHHWTSLSPMMEIGLDLARSHAEGRALKLVGYYQATDRITEAVLQPVGERVASSVRDGFADAVAIVVDGGKLTTEESPLVVCPYLPSSSSTPASWRPSTSTLDFSSNILRLSMALARAPGLLQDKFGDFDDHLEDVTVDWLRNGAVEDELKKLS
ncbi:UPF0172-domain-containing protein [Stereum hirsutum FP-91666 SS1]|uniref:UPF0172-domain-containing protein n=1 Tax=Stereum hirsutum (strain FP-91666) TaxID=721885 RepID=UPI000444A73F|nr:UPF0172-domain-containing protein [Stereum hirsutum FP-91666 SS1]EIM84940.1 UPF0172-domain-containing protein [Stereum hirsutum FP-91666 SS1]